MANRSAHAAIPFRLAMGDGEVVEVDGSTVLDEDSGLPAPAVVLRMPVWRAHALGHVLAEWTAIADLFDGTSRPTLAEGDLAWALYAASGAAGDPEADVEAGNEPTKVTSGQRAAAAAVLRDQGGLATHALISVVDAAAWWVDQHKGHSYAKSLLAAVTRDDDIAAAAYLALVRFADQAD